MLDIQYRTKASHGCWLLLGLTSVGLLVLAVPGCGNTGVSNSGRAKKLAAGDDVPRVQTVTVQQQDLARKIELPGTVKGFETADLYAKVEEFLEAHSTPYRSGYAVNLALEELVVNVMRYAYMDFDENLTDIDLSIIDEQIILVSEDYGSLFGLREVPSRNPHLVVA